jgi:hypothetical protein
MGLLNMQTLVDPQLLELIQSVEKDVSKVINEAINLWLKEKILTCPLSENFCKNPQIACNECDNLE